MDSIKTRGYPEIRLLEANTPELREKAALLYRGNPHDFVNPPFSAEKILSMEKKGYRYFLIENTEVRVVGMCGLRMNEQDREAKSAYLCSLLILPEFRGTNSGPASTIERERIAKGLGAEVMTAGVDWNNAPAIKNYLELGYVQRKLPRIWLDIGNIFQGRRFFYFLRGFRKKF